MPPIVMIVVLALVASVVAVIIAVVLTAVFRNPDLPPGVSASWLLCVLLGRPYEPPRRRGTRSAHGSNGAGGRKARHGGS
jgi:hypothetical protein